MESERDRGTAGGAGEYRQAITALLLIVAAFISLSSTLADDSLRHIGLAFSENRSWGEVYPHSVFSKYPGYDPWWGFDQALRGIAAVAGVLPISRLTAQFLVLKMLSFLFLAAFLLLAVRRSGVQREVRSLGGLVAVAAFVGLVLSAPIGRMLFVRPFVLCALYLLLALPGGGALRGALGAGALAFFYPYLFWVYTVPVAASHLIRGDRRYGAAAAAATVAAAAVQPADFWGLLGDLVRSDTFRSQLDVKIMEFSPLTREPLLGTLLMLIVICALPFLPRTSRRIGVPHLLMLFFAPAALKYVRYLIDVELTLLFVICAGGLVSRWTPTIERIGEFWGRAAGRAVSWLPSVGDAGAAGGGGISLRPWIGVCAAVLVILVGYNGFDRQRGYRDLEQKLAVIPRGSVVLTEFNLQYTLLYVRPDLRLVPSCEIGFAAETIRDPYFRFFNEGDPCTLAAAVGADTFVSAGTMLLLPDRTRCLERIGGPPLEVPFRPLTLWKTTSSK